MVDRRTWGAPALQPYLDDPKVEELFIGAQGRVEARGQGGTIFAVEPRLLGRAAVVRLAGELAKRIGARSRQGTLHGSLPGWMVSIAYGPDVDPAPALCLTRQAPDTVDFSQLAAEGTLDPRVSIVLERASVAGVSLAVVGPRRAARGRIAGALLRAASPGRRVGALGVSADPSIIGMGSSRAASDLGVDLLMAREPSPAGWADVMIAGVPFVAELTAPDVEAALERLLAYLMLGRSDVGRAAAALLVAAGVDLFVEVGLIAGRDVAISVSEVDPSGDGLALRRIATRQPDGSTLLALSGSRVERRIERLSFQPRISAPPSTPPHSAVSRAAISGRGGLGRAVSGEFEVPDRRAVGRLSSEQLSELTPDQLVSQSFLVDVGDVGGSFSSEVRLTTEEGDEDEAWRPSAEAEPEGAPNYGYEARESEPAPIPDPADDRPSVSVPPMPTTPPPPAVRSKVGSSPAHRAPPEAPRSDTPRGSGSASSHARVADQPRPGSSGLGLDGRKFPRRPPIERLATEVGSGPSHGLVAAEDGPALEGAPVRRALLSEPTRQPSSPSREASPELPEFGPDETMELGTYPRLDASVASLLGELDPDDEAEDRGSRTATGFLAQSLTGEEAPLSPIGPERGGFATQLLDETDSTLDPDAEPPFEPATHGSVPADDAERGPRRLGEAKSGLRRRARP